MQRLCHRRAELAEREAAGMKCPHCMVYEDKQTIGSGSGRAQEGHQDSHCMCKMRTSVLPRQVLACPKLVWEPMAPNCQDKETVIEFHVFNSITIRGVILFSIIVRRQDRLLIFKEVKTRAQKQVVLSKGRSNRVDLEAAVLQDQMLTCHCLWKSEVLILKVCFHCSP